MKSIKVLIPKWILNEDWAVDIDPMNWRLVKRQKNKKTGKPTIWKIVGYYPKLEMLIEGMQRRMLLTASDHTTLDQHIGMVIDAHCRAVQALREQMQGKKYKLRYD